MNDLPPDDDSLSPLAPLTCEPVKAEESKDSAGTGNKSPDATEEDVKFQLPITEVTASNGRVVRCTYINHPGFNPKTNLCMSLHYIVVKSCPTRSAPWGYLLRRAIIYLLDFVLNYNSRHETSLHIVHIKDLTTTVFKSFMNYLRKLGKTQNLAFMIKSAITSTARETGVIPFLDLPPVTVEKGTSTEPLYQDGVDTLTKATSKVVDAIHQKIKTREIIDSAKPYTLEEIHSLIENRPTKEDILVWYKHRLDNGLPILIPSIIKRIKKCDDPEVRALAHSDNIRLELADLYNRSEEIITVPDGYDPKFNLTPSFIRIILDPHRVTKTLIDQKYPYGLTAHESKNIYSSALLLNFSACDDILKFLIWKLVRTPSYRTANNLPPMMSLDEHLALYYPTAEEMAAIALLMMLQAGWNKESVMDIDKDNFEHGLTATIEESQKIIFSEKFRSQGRDVPYENPKKVIARSDSENPYSLYNLILLAKDFSAPLAPYAEHLIDPLRNKKVNTMFSYLRTASGRKGSVPVATLDLSLMFSVAVNKFLQDNEVMDNGVRLTSASSLTHRLRATWFFLNKDETAFAFLSQLMGHESRETTDEFYDNSSMAKTKRAKRLRKVLEHVVKLLRTRKLKGLLSKEASQISNAKLSIFHLPYFERALWACANRNKPDWPGATTLTEGTKCKALEQCIFCSQLRVLQDSLPYLIERAAHVDELLRDRVHTEFGTRLEAERDVLNDILDKWNDDQAMNEAIRYRNLNSPMLPRQMQDLKMIFKTGDLDE